MANKRKNPGSFPSDEQELLLKAALFKGAASLQAFEQWKARSHIDRVDAGSFRLLPLLYRNLRSQGVEDPLMPKLKGLYRYTWVQNQKIFHRAIPVIQAFAEQGIPALLLKGAALTLLCYKDFGTRTMTDLDLMVQPENTSQAIQNLERLGWRALVEYKKKFIASHHASHFITSAGDDLDLHWHLLFQRCDPSSDRRFWQKAVSIQFKDTPLLTLNPTDHLIHTCVHGSTWNPVPPIRWVADAYYLISSGKIDWDRLVLISQELGLVLPLRETLAYLGEKLKADIPPHVLSGLEGTAYTEWQRREHYWLSRPLGFIPSLWVGYSQQQREKNPLQRIVGFPKYLKGWFGMESTWELSKLLAEKGIKRIRLIGPSPRTFLSSLFGP